jgi:hypothetical protein
MPKSPRIIMGWTSMSAPGASMRGSTKGGLVCLFHVDDDMRTPGTIYEVR